MRYVIFLAVLLTGCALSREKVETWSDSQIESMLGNEFYRRDPELLAEANRRSIFSSEELFHGIKEERIFIGMSERALIASWGNPIRINTHRNAYSTRKQYVYSGNRYVYVEGGKVVSVSY